MLTRGRQRGKGNEVMTREKEVGMAGAWLGCGWGILDDTKREQEVGMAMARIVHP